MILCADAHAHLYPCFSLETALRRAAHNLRLLAPAAERDEALLVLLLAERRDCHAFDDLANGRQVPPGYSALATADPEILRVVGPSGTLHVVAGRQLMTAEGLEVLALATRTLLPEGQALEETIAAAGEAGEAVLPWSPGKWTLARGRAVRTLLASRRQPPLLIGDSALRPAWMPAAPLLRRALASGLPVVAGSDPLPFRGEERRLGTYGLVRSIVWDGDRPRRSISAALRATPDRRPSGRRLSPFGVAWRLLRLRLRARA